MQSNLKSILITARAFLKHYVVAKHNSSTRSVSEALSSAYAAAELGLATGDVVPIQIVLESCMAMLLELDSIITQNGLIAQDLVGQADLKTIDLLIEVVVCGYFCPILRHTFDLRPTVMMDDMATLQPMPREILREKLKALVPLIKSTSPAFTPLKRQDLLAILMAGSVDLCCNPIEPERHATILESLLKSVPPQKLIAVLQGLLLRPCPPWAKNVFKLELTSTLTRPGGLDHVVAFVLQADESGNIPVERFEKLAALVSAVPSALSPARYMQVLVPQILQLFDDQSSRKETHRRAVAAIMRRLYDTHKEASIVSEVFWKPLASLTTDMHVEQFRISLERLTEATGFTQLRVVLLPGHVETIVARAYQAEKNKNIYIKDLFHRLAYRLIENDSTTDLIPGFDSILDFETCTEGAKDRRSSALAYFLCLLDHVRMDGTPIHCTQQYLILGYSAITDPIVKSEHLRLMLEIPSKYPMVFTSHLHSDKWTTAATAHFLKCLAPPGRSEVDDISVIYLNILRLQSDNMVIEQNAQESMLEELILTLQSVRLEASDTNLQETIVQLVPKFELAILRYKSSSLQNSTSVTKSTSDTSDDRSTQDQAKLYASALNDLKDDMVPNRAHGLYLIGELAKSRADEGLMQLDRLTPVILNLLGDEETFVYQNGIKALRKLVAAYGEPYQRLLEEAMQGKLYSDPVKERISLALSDIAQ